MTERGVAVSYETVRRWVKSFRTDDRGRPTKASPEASYDLAPRPGLIRELTDKWSIFGGSSTPKARSSMRWCNPSGNRHAALKPMRKALEEICLRSRTIGHRRFAVIRRRRPSSWDRTPAWSAGDGRTIEQRIRIGRHGGGSARCNGSRARFQPMNFCRRMPPSTTSSASNVISLQPKRTARFALWR